LGVQPNATKDEIKSAYKNMANLHHPDKHKGDKQKEELFKKISNAYSVVGNEKERRLYDQENFFQFQQNEDRNSARSGSSKSSNWGFDEDIFQGSRDNWGRFTAYDVPGDVDDFVFEDFDFRFQRRKKKKKKIPFDLTKLHIHLDVDITLEQLFYGTSKEVQYSRNALCHKCNGYGTKTVVKNQCHQCRGLGMISVNTIIGLQHVSCEMCNGSGELVTRKDKCTECFGGKTIRTSCKVPVVIPLGSEYNDLVVVKGQGHEYMEFTQGEEQHQGDVFVHLKETTHPIFERNGSDLLMKKCLSLVEALGGFNFELKGIDGKITRIHSQPNGKMVRPGTVYMVKGKGMPRNKYKQTYGNLFILLNVEFPNKQFLSNDAIQVLKNVFEKTKSRREGIDQHSTLEQNSNLSTDNKTNNTNNNNNNEKIYLTEVPFFSKLPKFASLNYVQS